MESELKVGEKSREPGENGMCNGVPGIHGQMLRFFPPSIRTSLSKCVEHLMMSISREQGLKEEREHLLSLIESMKLQLHKGTTNLMHYDGEDLLSHVRKLHSRTNFTSEIDQQIHFKRIGVLLAVFFLKMIVRETSGSRSDEEPNRDESINSPGLGSSKAADHKYPQESLQDKVQRKMDSMTLVLRLLRNTRQGKNVLSEGESDDELRSELLQEFDEVDFGSPVDNIEKDGFETKTEFGTAQRTPDFRNVVDEISLESEFSLPPTSRHPLSDSEQVKELIYNYLKMNPEIKISYATMNDWVTESLDPSQGSKSSGRTIHGYPIFPSVDEIDNSGIARDKFINFGELARENPAKGPDVKSLEPSRSSTSISSMGLEAQKMDLIHLYHRNFPHKEMNFAALYNWASDILQNKPGTKVPDKRRPGRITVPQIQNNFEQNRIAANGTPSEIKMSPDSTSNPDWNCVEELRRSNRDKELLIDMLLSIRDLYPKEVQESGCYVQYLTQLQKCQLDYSRLKKTIELIVSSVKESLEHFLVQSSDYLIEFINNPTDLRPILRLSKERQAYQTSINALLHDVKKQRLSPLPYYQLSSVVNKNTEQQTRKPRSFVTLDFKSRDLDHGGDWVMNMQQMKPEDDCSSPRQGSVRSLESEPLDPSHSDDESEEHQKELAAQIFELQMHILDRLMSPTSGQSEDEDSDSSY